MKPTSLILTLAAVLALAAAAPARDCPFPIADLAVQYAGHNGANGNAQFRLEIPLDLSGFSLVARDAATGKAHLWWSRVSDVDAAEEAVPGDVMRTVAVIREASELDFQSRRMFLELWTHGSELDVPSFCDSKGPIEIPPYQPGVVPYGPILTGANTAYLTAKRSAHELLLEARGAEPGAQGVLLVSLGAAAIPLLGGTLLVDPASVSTVMALRADKNGEVGLALPGSVDTMIPTRLYFQAAFRPEPPATDAQARPASHQIDLTNGLRIDAF